MDTMKDTKMQPATDAVIEELRMLAEDLYVNGYNRYSSAMSQAADELEQLRAKVERMEKVIDALGSGLNAVAKERDELRAKIEAAENDAAHQKALAASALRVAEGWERKCGELRAEVIYWKEQKEPGAAGWRALARILQAKIDAMEKQEPIGGMLEVSPHNYELRWYRPVPFGAKLYTLPGAKGENE